MKKNYDVIHSEQASLRNLEIQVGQLATELRNRSLRKLPTDTKTPTVGQLATELRNRSLRKLPTDTKTPTRKGKKQCQAIELRSGKEIPSKGGEIKEHSDSYS